MRSRIRRSAVFVLAPLALGALGIDACQPKDLVTVPSGSFLMGSPPTEPGRDADEAQRVVELTHAFAMMRTEVTQADFQRLSGFDPSYFPTSGNGARHPVEQVSWFDALAHANARSAAEGLPACFELSELVCADELTAADVADCATRGGIHDASVALAGVASVYECAGYRLATEAEWEYAARARTKSALSSGDLTHTGCSPLDPAADAIAQYCGNNSLAKSTQPVAGKAPNPWDLADMNGNVAEWTWDRYSRSPEGNVDPTGGESSAYRVVRGGAAWYAGAARLRNADRSGFRPFHRDRYVGFRLVRTLADGPADAPRADLVPALDPIPDAAPLPSTLPARFTRPDVGTPLSPAEVAAFTSELTGFWKDVGYLDWLYRTGRGMAAGTGYPDYGLYPQGISASKSGDVVTFRQTSTADNLMIPTGKLLNAVGSHYVVSGDERAGEVVEKYAKGIKALIDSNLWDTEDPEPALMVRTPFPANYVDEVDGRTLVVNYDGVKGEERFDWNAQTVGNPLSPIFGDTLWLRTWRSKDDVPHIFRTVPVLRRVAAEGADPEVRSAAAEALAYLERFARDMVDTGYYIRTKDKWGNAVIPLDPNGFVVDLASFVQFTPFIPDAECDNRLSAALIAYGDPRGQECGNGFNSLYEPIAGWGHYYNWAIMRYFHLSATIMAWDAGEIEVGLEHLEGLAARAEQVLSGDYPNGDNPAAEPDAAGFLAAAAAAGLPLTSAEARHIVEQYTASAQHYRGFANWDLWDASVPDGGQRWEPARDLPSGALGLRQGEMLAVMEYCASPYRNPEGAVFVDCDVVNDPNLWGSGGA